MELAQKVPRVIVASLHRDRDGDPKLLDRCTLPLTARGTVTRIVTELAVLEPADGAFRLLEVAPDATVDEVRAVTGAPLIEDEAGPWNAYAVADAAAPAPPATKGADA